MHYYQRPYEVYVKSTKEEEENKKEKERRKGKMGVE